MKQKEKKELPKLPYGEGTMGYYKDDLIFYKKTVEGKRLTVYGKTATECMKKMREAEAERKENAKLYHPTDTNAVALFQDAVYQWLFAFKKPELKGRAFDTMEGTYKNQLKGTSLGTMSIQYIESRDVQLFLNELSNKMSESTTKKTYSLLKQFFDYYYARDINNNPMNLVKLPKKQKVYADLTDLNNLEVITNDEEIAVLDDEEIEKLTEELEKPYECGRIGYSYGHMILFIMWTYMRIGEVLALQLKDIDFENKTINIYKAWNKERNRDEGAKTRYKWVLTTPKTRNGKRVIFVPDQAIEHLKKHLELHFPNADDNTFIFFSTHGNPMPDQYLNDILQKALKRADITTKVTIHGLRHTGISYCLRHGASVEVVSKQAGHNEIATTNNIYYNVIEEQKRKTVKELFS